MKIRTLIVDDDPAVIRLHTGYLSSMEGFTLVATVRSGADASARIDRGDIDLVLLDMNLPDFSGIEVLHRLRLSQQWSVDVLVISSARDGFTVRQALAAHVVGYLVKPFTKEAFVARLTEYRDERRALTDEKPIPLGQGDIDGLVSRRSAAAPSPQTAPAPLPKGLAPSTMRDIRAALDRVHPVSAGAIAASSGASRGTVRRYLDHLVRTGEVDISHRFGARGRPEVLYRITSG